MAEPEVAKKPEREEVKSIQVNGTAYQVADIKNATMGMFADMEEEFHVGPKELDKIGFRYQLKMAFLGLHRLDDKITLMQVRDLSPEEIAAVFVQMNQRRANENL